MNPATFRMTSVNLWAPIMPMALASSTVAVAVSRPRSSRTGTKRRTGSSKYVASDPGRPVRSAVMRKDNCIRAAKATSITLEYVVTHASRKMTRGIMFHQRGVRLSPWCVPGDPRAGLLCPQPALDTGHGTGVAFVVVSQQVQQPM